MLEAVCMTQTHTELSGKTLKGNDIRLWHGRRIVHLCSWPVQLLLAPTISGNIYIISIPAPSLSKPPV